ncbi:MULTISPECIES: hypothetical protein [Parabacteroides]|jgi:hypothetical protein|uniref:RNase H-like nuclease (RuvC/YqgF family) n=1 Tax=Parabacteroides faecis TaxID=1217282 RepID=A0ABR6KH81_9BACT|nr:MULTISPECIES: hypothetical protein [Parabacteroides]MBB4620870.1 putative RNase H-like nuclease (RuvC/YqgF family) [Parabacteroides faecis]RHR34915.1 hypothetical protein DWX23_23655 [Parabacteroides sp. AF18-52]GGJ92097.1 hypothetical protein GCM10007084_14750 [Parabacteroides faecis]
MDNPSSLTFFLFCFCWVALIAGAVLGYIIGVRMARSKERHRLVKEKIRKNKVAIYHYQKEKYDYIGQINRLEEDLRNLAEESELYKERIADLDYYQRKVRESEQIIKRLSAASEETIELPTDAFSLLIQLKQDPVRTNLTKPEWSELLYTTDLLFNNFLTELKQKSGITRHEEEICCLIKWNFPRKDQMAVFNNTTDALTKSKSRLKKRLQLDDKTDLDQFIRLYR